MQVSVRTFALNAAIVIEIGVFVQVTVEAYKFSTVIELQSARLIWQETIEGYLGKSVVGRDIGSGRQLVLLQVQSTSECVAAIG
ncbi:Uncharacterised protein [Acinetobacter baumannii]|nr:Uncharacterised protein [Acinetobacter baumannii]